VTGDELRQRFETLETEVLSLADAPAADAIRRRGRRRRRTVRAAGLLAVALLAAATAGGIDRWSARSDLRPAAPAPTTQPTPAPLTTAPPVSSTVPPTSVEPAPRTTRTATGAAAGRTGMLRVDGLGGTAFGTAQGDALAALQDKLGAPGERRSWASAQTPFGTCPGPVRAARWGRLYVLFTSGPTRYRPGGGWHLFAYQVDAVQRSVLDGQYSGPTPPPDPPPLRGYSPRTGAGIGFGSTLAQLRRAYGHRVKVTTGEPGNVTWFRVDLGAAGELSGSLSGAAPSATVRLLAAGAGCGE
jgi:hypothetical protein